MLSQTVEYALRAMVYLAAETASPRTTDEVAQATKVPKAYLAKVLQALVRAGLIQSRRGVRGGMALAKDPTALTILEVVNAVDPIPRIRTCPLGLPTHGARLCPLHHRLDQALAGVEAAFGGTTLAEVLAEPGQSVPLCDGSSATAAGSLTPASSPSPGATTPGRAAKAPRSSRRCAGRGGTRPPR